MNAFLCVCVYVCVHYMRSPFVFFLRTAAANSYSTFTDLNSEVCVKRDDAAHAVHAAVVVVVVLAARASIRATVAIMHYIRADAV